MRIFEHVFFESLKARLGYVFGAVVAVMMACVVCAPQALARETVEMRDNNGEEWGVADDITRIHVNKLDAGTHEQVKGATMAIIERDGGKVIDEWVTDGSTHELDKVLNINTVYILREVKAPDGYDKVEDVVFTVDEKEGVGLNILSWDEERAELTNGYTVSLYDQHEDIVKKVTKPSSTRTVAPKTGDETPLAPVGALAGAALIAIVALQIAKRRMKD